MAQIIQFPSVAAEAADVAARAAEEKRGEGSKCDPARTLADIKRGVREDIAAAVRSGALPQATYKVSARAGRRSGDHVGVVISGLRFPVTHPDKLEVLRRDGNDNRYHGPWMSDEAAKVRETIQAIVNAYGYDRSDMMTDYFDCAFYSDVGFADANREYEAAVAEARAEVRL